jgi:hypothetical protein
MRAAGITCMVAAAVVSAIGVAPASALASGSPLGPPAAPTTAPFQQCPAVYQDPSCGYLIDITSAGDKVYVDPAVSYYEGSDDVLVGVQNDLSGPISSIHVGIPGSGFRSFAFDGDGLCNPGGGPVPADCPFGPAGDPGDYFGPDTTLSVDPNPCPGNSSGACSDDGTVAFPTPLQPGQYTYFSLEAPFTGATVVAGTQNDVIQTNLSDGPNSGVHITDASPTAITDQATIMPSSINGSGATGSVTYSVYSDPGCTTKVADGGTKTLSGGSAPASDPFGTSLATNATYYVQATYTGDSNFNATTTDCGDETFTFGTPPAKAQASITTSLVGSNGASGAQITVPTGTAVHDAASITFNGTPQNGRVTYYAFNDSGCTSQVAGVNLGGGASTNGAYPPSATVTLPNGTYYFQAIYSGNQTLAGARSPCTESVTVEPPCTCAKISAYANAFHTFGASSTRLELNIRSAVTCTAGAGGCSGGFTLTAPGRAQFIDASKTKNGALGLKLNKSIAMLTFLCVGPCAATTVQQTYTLQWVALKRIKIVTGRAKRRRTIIRTIQAPGFLPKGRAGRTLAVALAQSCNGVLTKRKLSIRFDKHGNVDYKKSDLNGDGIADGKQLTDLTGFV